MQNSIFSWVDPVRAFEIIWWLMIDLCFNGAYVGLWCEQNEMSRPEDERLKELPATLGIEAKDHQFGVVNFSAMELPTRLLKRWNLSIYQCTNDRLCLCPSVGHVTIYKKHRKNKEPKFETSVPSAKSDRITKYTLPSPPESQHPSRLPRSGMLELCLSIFGPVSLFSCNCQMYHKKDHKILTTNPYLPSVQILMDKHSGNLIFRQPCPGQSS